MTSALGQPYYWGLHLELRSRRPTADRANWLPRFSVQRLAAGGGPTEDITYFDEASETVSVAGQEVAPEVLVAIRRLPEGTGVYLSREGRAVEPF